MCLDYWKCCGLRCFTPCGVFSTQDNKEAEEDGVGKLVSAFLENESVFLELLQSFGSLNFKVCGVRGSGPRLRSSQLLGVCR